MDDGGKRKKKIIDIACFNVQYNTVGDSKERRINGEGGGDYDNVKKRVKRETFWRNFSNIQMMLIKSTLFFFYKKCSWTSHWVNDFKMEKRKQFGEHEKNFE